MKKKQLGKCLKVFLPLLYSMFLLILFFEGKYIQRYKELTIVPRPDSGYITFRGAMVDGKWLDPREIVENLAEGGWTFNEEGNTWTTTNGQPLRLHLPFGNTRDLVFNVGPDEGIVEIYVEQNVHEIDLRRQEPNDSGEAFSLPKTLFINQIKQEYASLAFIVLFVLLMAACNYYCSHARKGEGRKDTKRNGAIELLRFYLALCVLTHHYFGLPPGGYLGVDFFFILSGYLLMEHYLRQKKENTSAALAAVLYTKQRYLRLIPMYLFAFLFSIGITVCRFDAGLPWTIIKDSFLELAMLPCFGLEVNTAVATGWYCSALLISGFCVYLLLTRNKETYINVIAPLSLFLIFGWIRQKIGHLNRWGQYDSFIATGALRGFAEMGLGCICYEIVSKLREKNIRSRWTCTTMELLCVFYMSYAIWKAAPSDSDFVVVFAMAILILSLFVGGSLWSKLFQNRLSQYLGSISFGIYLIHPVMLKIGWDKLGAHFGLSRAYSFATYLLFVLVLAAVSTRFVDNILWYLRREQLVIDINEIRQR